MTGASDGNGAGPVADGLAPWSWDDYEPGEVAVEFARLVEWVEALRLRYKSTVRLPACWPRHPELVDELKLFWVWDLMLRAARHPEEAIRWHGELRRSAEAWRRLANCDHEEPSDIDREIAEKRRRDVQHHLQLALRERASYASSPRMRTSQNV